MLRTTTPVAWILILLIAGCNSAQDHIIGGKNPPKKYKAVVSLSPGTTELFGQMIKTEIMRGRTSACNWPNQARSLPIVAGVKPDYEKLAKVKPDLIVYDKDLYSEQDVAKIKQICPDIFVMDATSLKDYEREAILLSSMVGGETPMSLYLDNVFQAQHSALANAPANRPKVAVIMPGEGSEHMICGIDSFQADEIRNSGGEPAGPPGSKFVTLNPETMAKLDPDYVLTAGSPDGFVKDTRFANLKAVKAGHVFGMNPDIVLRRGGRVDIFISNVARVLHGNALG